MDVRLAQPFFRFGSYVLDLREGELRKNGSRIRIQEKPLKLLSVLINHPGEIVTRSEIQNQLWPGDSYLSFEDGLNTVVKKLREALCDNPENPRYIQTVPRRGYRFIASVEVVPPPTSLVVGSPQAPAAAPPISSVPPHVLPSTTASGLGSNPPPTQTNAALVFRRLPFTPALLGFAVIALAAVTWVSFHGRENAHAGPRIESLAVLPLENLSGDPNQEYFADGITDELITNLAQLGTLRVTSRTSVMQYRGLNKTIPDIRRELGVDAVIEGSVVRMGNKVRVDAQLIETSDDRHLWAQSFEGDEQDLMALQDDLARSVAERVRVALGPNSTEDRAKSHPVSTETYEAYLRGLYFLNQRTRDGLNKSIEYFDRATQQDPDYAPAEAGLAQAYNMLSDYDFIPDSEAEPKAKAAAVRALTLDGSLPDAHAALAFTLWHYDWNWTEAAKEFQVALTENPNDSNTHHWFALFLAAQGNFPRAQQELEKARQLDPLSLIVQTNLGWLSYFQRDFPQAERQFQDVLQIDPVFPPAHTKLWLSYVRSGNDSKAIQELTNALRLAGAPELSDQIGERYRTSGLKPALSEFIEEGAPRGFFGEFQKAMLLALDGDKTAAIDSLNRAANQRDGWMVYIRIEPALDSLRSDPRFQALLSRLNNAD